MPEVDFDPVLKIGLYLCGSVKSVVKNYLTSRAGW
jgi:hypothetical protein